MPQGPIQIIEPPSRANGGHSNPSPISLRTHWRKWKYIYIIGALVGALLIFWFYPRLKAIYYLYWGYESFKPIFYNRLGYSDNVSTLLSTAVAFIYGVVGIFFAAWVVHVFRRFTLKQFILGFASFVALYALSPLIQIVAQPFGGMVCFNQNDGTPSKWYVIRAGEIIIFDSPGYDPVDGVQKLPVSSTICRLYDKQKRGISARKITAQEAVNLAPKVWYATAGGRLDLFDNEGLKPDSTELLLPITEAMLSELRAKVERERRETEARLAKEHLEQQKAQAERERLEAIKAAKERLDQQKAQAERDKAEAERQRIEAERQRTEAERLAKEEADRERQRKEQEEARIVGTVRTLVGYAQDSKTGLECSFRRSKVIFPGIPGESNISVAYADTRVNVSRFGWEVPNIFPLLPAETHTAVGVQLIGMHPSSGKKMVCFAYALSPSPDNVPATESKNFENVVNALENLGAVVAQRQLTDERTASADPKQGAPKDSPMFSFRIILNSDGANTSPETAPAYSPPSTYSAPPQTYKRPVVPTMQPNGYYGYGGRR